ncbi:phosphoglycolate phosphatase [Salarchaeum japonicum]|uniref:Phosphoglycolate phosphatase n=1 Tax=Salarchaeum japonicum TaxID=555573 RepID=A0AAV3T1M2_9EURY|nr:phosphoglycolate phosphatase [Salarchaeum japonicum]
MVPPLAVDIDGTLSRADRSIDSRVLDVLREWDAPVVVATGKALPYPVALCGFIGVPERVVAENGGVSYDRDRDRLHFHGDREAAQDVVDEYVARGHSLGWGDVDLVNRWRETEVAVSRDQPLAPLREIAEKHGLHVVDTGFAYHVKSPGMHKGRALESLVADLDYAMGDFVAVGDSANDVELLEAVGTGYAVANADDDAKAAADHVVAGAYADGFLDAVDAALAE